ncbi:MAG: diaminopropionate ammonia-lyase [Alphaproteobacteria bacterium]
MRYLLNDRGASLRQSEIGQQFSCDPAPVFGFLNRCPAYRETPLVALDELGDEIGIAGLYAKNETDRMGLGSFKALGGVYAVASILLELAAHHLNRHLTVEDLVADPVREIAGRIVFTCASAGNHGLSVATGARLFGAKSVVYISENVPAVFAKRLEAAGASVRREGATYEDSMAAAQQAASENGWLLLADSSWSGYTDYPSRIMQGYSVMGHESERQFSTFNVSPSHIFLQAGVGGLAASIARYVRVNWGDDVRIVVVEPDAAPCLFESMAAGRLTRADGPTSNMGRLDCKEASLLAFETLSQDANAFVTVSDQQSEQSAALLASYGLATTPSGAAGLAGLIAAHGSAKAAQDLALDGSSIPLIVVSEGPSK